MINRYDRQKIIYYSACLFRTSHFGYWRAGRKIRAHRSEEFFATKLSIRLISIDVLDTPVRKAKACFAVPHRNTKFFVRNYGGLGIVIKICSPLRPPDFEQVPNKIPGTHPVFWVATNFIQLN